MSKLFTQMHLRGMQVVSVCMVPLILGVDNGAGAQSIAFRRVVWWMELFIHVHAGWLCACVIEEPSQPSSMPPAGAGWISSMLEGAGCAI